ncbi:MAG: formylmethanofuran dehydrogenase [Deltaproteobacteria bacterium]|nr:formylmethanofuran dehydrogenase [Deltaproteobacteria bacterium]MBW2121981.1 formylmethanofuran dehydrogenase [Deltaproteobacteria bacterium]
MVEIGNEQGDFKECVGFHGHVCPGLAIGFQAARVLMKELGVRRASDEELVAIVENDACGVDAIQVMTGCTFGKGNFIFKNYGKQAFTLIARNRRRAVRACLRPGVLDRDRSHLALFEKVQDGDASPEETKQFTRLHGEQARRILEADPHSLFKIEEVSTEAPPRARIVGSEICDGCGEPARIDMLSQVHGQRLCIACARRRFSSAKTKDTTSTKETGNE